MANIRSLIKNNLTILIILGFSVIVALLLPSFSGKQITFKAIPTPTVAIRSEVTSLTYKGAAGKDALTILKEKAKIEQDKSGLVVSINGRKADNAKHEYWAFYVNNTMAEVGPADYQTKDTDTISWKIEKY